MKAPFRLVIISIIIIWLAITGWFFFTAWRRPQKQTLNPSPAIQTNAPTARKNFLINYTPENYQLFLRSAQPNDRLLFFRAQVLKDPKSWPDPARRLTTGRVLTSWPSWEIAQQYISTWAPNTDIFAYDIEADSGAEAQNLSAAISLIRSELNRLSDQYNHPIQLSCGLNYNYGPRHISELSACDDVHIHANELLRSYPQPDPKTQLDYAQWAVFQAKAIRQINPRIEIWFAALLKGISADTAVEVARQISFQMAAANLNFTGFTAWSDSASFQSFLNSGI